MITNDYYCYCYIYLYSLPYSKKKNLKILLLNIIIIIIFNNIMMMIVLVWRKTLLINSRGGKIIHFLSFIWFTNYYGIIIQPSTLLPEIQRTTWLAEIGGGMEYEFFFCRSVCWGLRFLGFGALGFGDRIRRVR